MKTQHLRYPNSVILKHDGPSTSFPTPGNTAGGEQWWAAVDGSCQEGRSKWVIHAHPSIPAPRGVAECQWLHGYGLGMSLPSPLAMQGVYKYKSLISRVFPALPMPKPLLTLIRAARGSLGKSLTSWEVGLRHPGRAGCLHPTSLLGNKPFHFQYWLQISLYTTN